MASSHPTKGGSDAGSVPGDKMPVSTTLLDKGAGIVQGLTQNLTPVKKIHQHLCAFHVYAHDLSRQVEAHHFCSHLNEDIQQCVIYDTDESNARLIGIEYVIKDTIFATLPPEEKKMWHSHEYEVKSGELVLPGVPKVAEQAVLRQLAKTYGKTWHFWQYDRGDKLPLGLPQLMAAITEDGQLDPKVLEERDARYGNSTSERRKERQEIQGPEKIDPLADYYRTGKGLQVVELREEELELPRHL